ncbi:MAG TPA: DNA/RNA nuclease SfsA [Methanomicrobia archaeon]|nr:DNA/RNA nuclease SfsA [Methanomicrobia archaeon]
MPELVKLFQIEDPLECRIRERLNRFVVLIAAGEREYRAHLTNTGRLSEFMITGQRAFCFKTYHPGTTDFRLFAIEEHGLGALIDTWLQMTAFEVALNSGRIPWLANCGIVKRNAQLGASRIDYLLTCGGTALYLEVKSAVLREGTYALYPDCPSERGRKHIRELLRIARDGVQAKLVFMAALPNVTAFKPNRGADLELFEALKVARDSGVDLKALGLYYHPDDAWVYLYDPELPVSLGTQSGQSKIHKAPLKKVYYEQESGGLHTAVHTTRRITRGS